jgi:DNA-binding transcriptional LysR family regulator
VLCLSLQDRDNELMRQPIHWIGKPHLAALEILPLVLLPEPFAYRMLTLQALERSGRRYRIVVETPSVEGLKAALEAGLGITARTLDFLPEGAAAQWCLSGLPPLPEISYVLHHTHGAPGAELAALIRRGLTGGRTGVAAPRKRAARG